MQIRWLPDYLFFDMRNSPAAAFFPEGANYSGMQVKNKTNAFNFTMQVVIPFAHPNISNIQKTGYKALSGLAKANAVQAAKTPMLSMTYDAAQVNVEYTENGKQYEEIIITILKIILFILSNQICFLTFGC